ncbi:unnamed protein product [Coffea canephora]|uniref:Homeobox domain-containing protein n=1 Tax=Coffea canephora TaxID=49390 RepID=A0A068UTH9_COFCA|nr:unnamed protein product [Coffea canephora]
MDLKMRFHPTTRRNTRINIAENHQIWLHGLKSKNIVNYSCIYNRKISDLMNMFFKANPHPNQNERKELGNELGVDSREIKFWFQNKRNQVKAQIARAENQTLSEENQRIHSENMMLMERIRYPICLACATANGQDDDRKLILRQLLIENAQLKEEVYFTHSNFVRICVLTL